MNKDFEWLKWVGLVFVISVLGAVIYVKQSNKSKLENFDETQQNVDKKHYDEQLDETAKAISDVQLDAQQTKETPPVYEAVNLEQTKKFIDRVEKLRSEDSKVNLEYLPDVAAHSRKYNSLIEEAEIIYGTNDITNPMRFCSAIASYASEMWRVKYSKDNNTPEDKAKIQTMFLASYNDAKNACIENINEAQK